MSEKSLDETGSLIGSFGRKSGGSKGCWSLIPHLAILSFARRAGIQKGMGCTQTTACKGQENLEM